MTFLQHAWRIATIALATAAGFAMAAEIVVEGHARGQALLSIYIMVPTIFALFAWFFTYIAGLADQGCGGGPGTGRMGCGGF
jgi:hypothetical protein